MSEQREPMTAGSGGDTSSLRVPAFRRLTAAWSCSNFGDSALFLTLAIWVKDLTGSDAKAGLVFLFLGLPVFLAPFAGQLADRVSRRRLVAATNLVAAVGVLALGLVKGAGDLWLIYAVTFGYGFLGYVTSAAGSGLVRDILDDDQLPSGNGVLSTIDQGMRLLSPLAGAAVYALFGGFAIAVLTASALAVAALVTTTVRVDETPPPADRERFRTELTAGARHIRAVPVLAQLTLTMAVAFAVTGFSNSTIFAAIDQGLGRGSSLFGVLAAIQGGGSVLGGVTAAAVVRRLGETTALGLGLAMLGLGLGAVAAPTMATLTAASLVVGVSIPWMMVAFATIRQRMTPGRLQGRVSAATNMALNGPQTVGTALGAALIAVVDYRLLGLFMAVVVAVCAVPALLAHAGSAEPAEPAEPALATQR
jgi:MFS family permease